MDIKQQTKLAKKFTEDLAELIVNSNKKLNKNDISQPTDFRLVQHIGLENNNFKV